MDSVQRREQGNALYKAGKIDQAIPLYQQAAALDPRDPAPLSNLSAAYFESGQYAKCIEVSDQALDLLEDSAKRDKLHIRQTKAFIYSREYAKARLACQHIPNGTEKSALSKALDAHSNVRSNEQEIRAKLITELPRCKTPIQNVPEYYVFGHDTPSTLYDATLQSTGRDKISLFFGGIGDGRNLHHTLIGIWADELSHKAFRTKKYHMTIVDIKPAAIARNVLVLLLFDALARKKDFMDRLDTFLFPTLYYTYVSSIMPDQIHSLLQIQITKAISMIEKGQLPSFLDVPELFRIEVIRLLKEWQHDAGQEYPIAMVRKETVWNYNQSKTGNVWTAAQYGLDMGTPQSFIPPGCEKEEAFYKKTGILMMSWAGHGNLLEQDLRDAFEKFEPSQPTKLNMDFLTNVDRSWKTNPTFVDLEWQNNRDRSHRELDVEHDPFRVGQQLRDAGMAAPEEDGLFNEISYWFTAVINAFKSFRPRLKIEACIGDVTTVLEEIRYGIVGHRQLSSNISSPASDGKTTANFQSAGLQSSSVRPGSSLDDYPKTYDRIHLSNIPDYIGGTLSTFLYALPTLNIDSTSYVTATCLRNPPRFKSHNHFNNEYIALSSPLDLEKAFKVRLRSCHDDVLPMAEYAEWEKISLPTTFSTLLPNSKVETWLFTLFLKIAIPKERQMRDFALIYSPLNLTAILRLCSHLHNIGYPAHWLNEVLDAIASGTISTAARPPRSEPLTLKDAKSKNPVIHQSTQPFVAEFTTLIALWHSLLPFGVISQHLPSPDTIHKYETSFNDDPRLEEIAEPPAFILVLSSFKLFPESTKRGLRPFLMSDENGATSVNAVKVRNEGIHILSTWKWERRTRTATFWLRKDVFNALDDDWGVSIWRTDSWALQNAPHSIRNIRDLGQYIQ